MADAAAQEMRHDEADEADDSCHCDRAADRERRAADHEPLRAPRLEPQARGRLLAERERVESARGRDHEQPAGQHQRQRERHVDEAAVGERAEHPEQDL